MTAAAPSPFDLLLRAIAAGDAATARTFLNRDPGLARTAAGHGATRDAAAPHFLAAIGHYVYAGDTALHIAGAAHAPDLVAHLLALGADPAARNRRGATPLHYAADGRPGAAGWDGDAQARTILCLLEAGADADVQDKSGVTPLHRAVRTRGAAAAAALLKAGADPDRRNRNGSTARDLATRTTGRGGSGLPEARAEQVKILEMFEGF